MIAYGISDKGRIRPTNQDAYAIDLFDQHQCALLVVCDGMGGANAGNVASRFAIDRFRETVKEGFCTDADMDVNFIQDLLRISAQEANHAVFELSARQPEFRGMGTTLVAALILHENAVLVNVGDSRAYLIADECAIQITEDHSYVQEMVRKGKLTPEESRHHPHRNLITRAIGVDSFVDSDIIETILQEGQTLLLCTDGLTGMVEDSEIANIVCQADSLAQAAELLVNRACEYGGADNVTVVLFRRDKPAE